MSNKNDIARRFGQADHYDTAAHIQKRAAHLLIKALSTGELIQNKPPQRILELGCGTGYLSAQLIQLFPQAHYVLSDISSEMLTRTKERLCHLPPLMHPPLFLTMDAETPPKDLLGPFDLIISNLCVQWFCDQKAAFARLSQHLSAGGLFLATNLLRNSLEEWRHACDLAQISCGVPEYPTLAMLAPQWPSNGRGQWEEHLLTDPIPSALTFLRSLHQIGASQPQKHHRPASAAALKRAMACFDQHSHHVTYHLGLGLFIKDSV